jgi:histidine ammonia-lyase
MCSRSPGRRPRRCGRPWPAPGPVTACELLAGYQAGALSGRPAPAGSRPVVGRLAEVVGPITADRPFGEDVERIIGLLAAAPPPW